MARIGINPARDQWSQYRPSPMTVAILVQIPALVGYHQQRLEIFKMCLQSLLENTDRPFDLMVFDNASCPEVSDYLTTLKSRGWIQYIISSQQNIGKMGAFKIMFKAAPGNIIAYSDDDIYFYPGWMEAHLEILESFPRAGMVSGLPVLSSTDDAVQSTLAFARDTPGAEIIQGALIPEEWQFDHALSIGRDPDEWTRPSRQGRDRLLRYDGREAFVSATHFQFVARKEVILQALPEEWSGRLMREMRQLDREVDRRGYLRLSTRERTVQHLGNVFDERWSKRLYRGEWTGPKPKKGSWEHRLMQVGFVRRILQGLYNRLFWLLSLPQGSTSRGGGDHGFSPGSASRKD